VIAIAIALSPWLVVSLSLREPVLNGSFAVDATISSRQLKGSVSPEALILLHRRKIVRRSCYGPSHLAKWRHASLRSVQYGHSGLDLLTLSFSHFDPSRHFAPPIAAWRKNYSITTPAMANSSIG